MNKLKLSSDKKIWGVCGGFAEYFRLDPTLMRIIWVLAIFLLRGMPVLIYLVCYVILPKE